MLKILLAHLHNVCGRFSMRIEGCTALAKACHRQDTKVLEEAMVAICHAAVEERGAVFAVSLLL